MSGSKLQFVIGGASLISGVLLLHEGFPIVMDGVDEESIGPSSYPNLEVSDQINSVDFMEGSLMTIGGVILTVAGVVVMWGVKDNSHR